MNENIKKEMIKRDQLLWKAQRKKSDVENKRQRKKCNGLIDKTKSNHYRDI